ncbi:MAG: TlpA disulfide reductase family protein [Calditrichaceae bacterium]
MKTILLTINVVMILNSTSWSGQNVHNFRLQDIDNKWQQYEQLKGEKLTVLDFWATWCSPCVKAFPKLNEMYRKYQNKGVQFLGINIDSQKNNAKIKPFVKAYKIPYPILKDPNSQLASRLNVKNIPTLLIINSENEVVYRHQGYRFGDEEIIEEEILKILGEQENE